jgi:hypothetical protein
MGNLGVMIFASIIGEPFGFLVKTGIEKMK